MGFCLKRKVEEIPLCSPYVGPARFFQASQQTMEVSPIGKDSKLVWCTCKLHCCSSSVIKGDLFRCTSLSWVVWWCHVFSFIRLLTNKREVICSHRCVLLHFFKFYTWIFSHYFYFSSSQLLIEYTGAISLGRTWCGTQNNKI